MFISLYSTRLILNALGAEDFGVYSVIAGAIAMLGFLNAAMASATQRYLSFNEGKGDIELLRRVFNVSLLIHFIIGLIVGSALELLAVVFFNGILNIPENRIFAAKIIFHFMVISTIINIMSVPYNAVIVAHENMLLFSIVGIFEAILKLLTAFIVVYTLYDKLIIYGLCMAAIAIIVLIIYRIYSHSKYQECVFAPRKYIDRKLGKEMLGFAGWNFLGSASGMIAGYGSGIILNHFHGAIANAANGIAAQLTGQLQVFSTTMQKALNPVIDKSEGGGKRELMIKATLSGSKFSFLFLAFFSIPFIIETPIILQLWLKNVPKWAVIFTRLGIVYALIEQTTRLLGTAIMAVGNIKNPNLLNSFIILLNLMVLFFVFWKGLPPYYMPLLAIIAAFFLALSKLFYANKYCGITHKLFFKEVLIKISIVFWVSVILGIIPWYFLPPTIYRLLAVSVLSMSSFIGFIVSLF